jgi:UPF0716 protein FxsA
MSAAHWILLGAIALPIAEVVAFIAIASQIGWWAALALTAATSLAGAAVVRSVGRAALLRVRASAAGDVLDVSGPGALTVVAGLLLLAPGFLTDAAGALLLVPALQRRLIARLKRKAAAKRRGEPGVVELEPHEWRRLRDEESGKEPTR